MALSKKEAINQIGTDFIELNDFDYDDNGNTIASYKEQLHIFECKDFNIECDLSITSNFKVITSSRLSPEEHETIAEGIEINNFKVILDDGELKDNDLIQVIYNEYLKSIYIS